MTVRGSDAFVLDENLPFDNLLFGNRGFQYIFLFIIINDYRWSNLQQLFVASITALIISLRMESCE